MACHDVYFIPLPVVESTMFTKTLQAPLLLLQHLKVHPEKNDGKRVVLVVMG